MMWKKAAIVAGLMVLGLAVGYLVFAHYQGTYLELPAFWGQRVPLPGEAVALSARITGFWLTGLAGIILGAMLVFLVEPRLAGPQGIQESQRFQSAPPPTPREAVYAGSARAGSLPPVQQIVRPVLRGICGEYAGAVFPLEREIVIGRDPQVSSVVLDDAKISRRHCTVRYDQARGLFLVTDTSSGGTFLQPGNRRLQKDVPTPVPQGGSISFNASACRFEMAGI